MTFGRRLMCLPLQGRSWGLLALTLCVLASQRTHAQVLSQGGPRPRPHAVPFVSPASFCVSELLLNSKRMSFVSSTACSSIFLTSE